MAGVRPFRITLQGHKRVSKSLRTLSVKVPAMAARALNKEAELTITQAKRWTPVETGRLKGTGKVQKHATPGTLWARLTYGTNYAIYVHEIPPANKGWGSFGGSPTGFDGKKKTAKKKKRTAYHKPPTRYKFLSGAIKKRAPMFTKRIAKSISNELKSLGGHG
jgi:hypothetical protein